MKIKLLTWFLVNSLLLPTALAKQPSVTVADDGISQSRYIFGGVVGSSGGFGIGHAIQKRYAKSKAWIFTATETAALVYIFSSTLFACDGAVGDQYNRCMHDVNQKVLAGSIAYWGFHIWEIFDVWTGVKVRETPASSLALVPGFVNPRTLGLMAVLQFN